VGNQITQNIPLNYDEDSSESADFEDDFTEDHTSNSDNDADAGNPNAAMAHQPVAAVED